MSAAIDRYLTPLQGFLRDKDVTEVVIQRPGECWVYAKGHATRHAIGNQLSYENLRMLATLAAGYTSQAVDETHPLVSGSLPNGNRIQCVIPPATETGIVVIAIRHHSVVPVTFDDYVKRQAFSRTVTCTDLTPRGPQELGRLYASNDPNDRAEFIRRGVAHKLNFLISGGTGCGKTHFQRALLSLVPADRRIITIEDVREISYLPHENIVHLLYSRGQQARSKHTASDLVRAALRLRPDHIHIGELRGEEDEASSYLQAINTGHPGAITTIHANSAEHALEQLAHMVMRGSRNLRYEQAYGYVKSVIDVVIHMDIASDPPYSPVEILYVRATP